jgi:RimJ/RimL family protein N-acetyltransferase
MHLSLSRCEVRSFQARDVDGVALHANNRKIWLNMRDRFPHPYSRHDAVAFLDHTRRESPESSFAIVVDGAAVGAIGFVQQPDVERVSAEIGYWIGEPFWGRGITTEALTAVTAYAIGRHDLTRVFALPFAYNAASCRVLEKAGYVLECCRRRSAIKDGRIVDQLQYAFVVPGP